VNKYNLIESQCTFLIEASVRVLLPRLGFGNANSLSIGSALKSIKKSDLESVVFDFRLSEASASLVEAPGLLPNFQCEIPLSPAQFRTLLQNKSKSFRMTEAKK
jgi:predicted N-acyltransferase